MNDFESLGFKPAETGPSQSKQPDFSSLGFKRDAQTTAAQLDENRNTLMSRAKATMQGVIQGINNYGSTIQKIVTPVSYPILKAIGLGDVARSPESVQPDYEAQTNAYKTNPDVQAHPNYAGAGEFAGSAAWQAPLLALTGGAAGPISAGMSKAAPFIAKAGASLIDNTALGGLTAGLMNNPGNKEIFNTDQAKMGAMTGAVLSGVGSLGEKYLGGVQAYDNYKTGLKKQGYTGPVFSTDVPDQGIGNAIQEKIVNGVSSKIPIVNSIPGIGVNAARQAQLDGAQDAVKQLVGGLSDKYPNGGYDTFKRAINSSKTTADQAIAESANQFRSVLDANNVNIHTLTNTQPLIDNLLNSDAQLSKSIKTRLQTVVNDGTATTDQLLGSPKQMGLKQQIFQEAQRLGKDRANTINYDASNDLMQIYHSLNQDIETNVQNIPNALEAFHNFNTTTQGLKTLWSPENSPLIAKAAADVNDSKGSMMRAFNAMLGKGTSMDPQIYQKYAYMAGPEGRSAIRVQALQDAMNSSMDKQGNLNISQFLDKVTPTPGSNQEAIMKPVQDALAGIQQLAQQVNKGTQGQRSPLTMTQLLTATPIGAGAIAAGMHNPGVVAAVTAAPAVLGTLTAHPPVKNALMFLNQLTGGGTYGPEKQGLATYLLNSATKQLSRAGVIMKTMDDGSVHFDKEGN